LRLHIHNHATPTVLRSLVQCATTAPFALCDPPKAHLHFSRSWTRWWAAPTQRCERPRARRMTCEMAKCTSDRDRGQVLDPPYNLQPFLPLPRTGDRELAILMFSALRTIFLNRESPMRIVKHKLRQHRLLIEAVLHVSGSCDLHLPQHLPGKSSGMLLYSTPFMRRSEQSCPPITKCGFVLSDTA
jgi:hypothetical protein